MTARRRVDYRWRLREIMAAQGLWKTTELTPLLQARGVELSNAQTYRLVTGRPQRLSLLTLAALCDILNCTASDLIETTATTGRTSPKVKPGPPAPARPRRAQITEKA
ncbi:MAG TPA: helix-turn-helix transcriptional regulator [Acidimicrobiales bacterium]|nr:helix-turn-helix transcriptional regulator [Acidimicrobiales bacterium]